MIDVPAAVAVPWSACVETATLVGAPPVMFSVMGLLLLPCATVALTAFATGGTTKVYWSAALVGLVPLALITVGAS